MTLEQLLTSLITLLTRAGGDRVSASDILLACQNIVNYFASRLASIIPDWEDDITFNTDGSGAGKYCKYPDTTGRKRIFETKTDGNINHLPPASGGENTYWKEISESASSAIKEWEAGVYGPGLIIVFHNHSTAGRGLYVLLEATRPFNSTNIETELAASKWERISGDPGVGGGGTWGSITGTLSSQTDLITYIGAQIAGAVAGLMDLRGAFDASGGSYPSSGGSGTAGAILKADCWIISVAGTLPTGQAVSVGDIIFALQDTPGNTQANWGRLEMNLMQATEVAAGIGKIAAQSTVNTGTNDTDIVTPLKLKTKLSLNDSKTDDYATVSTDNQKFVFLSAAVAKTVTVDQLAAGTYISFLNIGLGQWNFTEGSGVTLHGTATALAGGEINSITLFWLTTTDVYIISGVSNTVSSLSVTGALAIRAGLSSGTIAKVGGVIGSSVTQTGNVGTGEDDLFLFEVPANTLGTDKACIVAVAAGTFAANANNKRIRVRFGGTVIFDTTALALNAGDWFLETRVFRSGSSAQKCVTVIRTSNSSLVSTTDYTTAAVDLSTALELKITAEATSNNDVVGELFKVSYEPNE